MFQTDAKLIKKEKLKSNVFSFWLECKKISEYSKPGQFVNVLVEDCTLRRPISICEIEKNLIRIVFVVRGKGTKKISTFQTDKYVNLIGPLGKWFSLHEKTKENALLIGGGIGCAPLLELQKKLNKSISLLGFNKKEDIILAKDFEKYGELLIYTVDGSYGEKGFVTKNLEKIIRERNIKIIAACGPEKMLEAIILIAKKMKICCEISFEERMACGIGACLCCQKILNITGEKKIFHVCSDGPVIHFNFSEFIY